MAVLRRDLVSDLPVAKRLGANLREMGYKEVDAFQPALVLARRSLTPKAVI